jgi:hypothetical protein
MGEAKRRGTYEERKSARIAEIDERDRRYRARLEAYRQRHVAQDARTTPHHEHGVGTQRRRYVGHGNMRLAAALLAAGALGASRDPGSRELPPPREDDEP